MLDKKRLITATTVEKFYKNWVLNYPTKPTDYLLFLEKNIEAVFNKPDVQTNAMSAGHTAERMVKASIEKEKNTFYFSDKTYFYELTDNEYLNSVFGATPDLLTTKTIEDAVFKRTYEIKSIQTDFSRLSNSLIEKDMFQVQWQSFICDSDEIVYITVVIACLENGRIEIISKKEKIIQPDINLQNNFIKFCDDTIEYIALIRGIKFNYSKTKKQKRSIII